MNPQHLAAALERILIVSACPNARQVATDALRGAEFEEVENKHLRDRIAELRVATAQLERELHAKRKAKHVRAVA